MLNKQPPNHRNDSQPRILIIDENEAFASRLKSALSDRYCVDIFPVGLTDDPAEMVSPLLKNYDNDYLAIIIEANLGGKGQRLKRKGIEIVKRLRCAIQSRLSRAPVILTSFEEKKELLNTRKTAIVCTGGCHFLSNPLSLHELQETLQSVKLLSTETVESIWEKLIENVVKSALIHSLGNIDIEGFESPSQEVEQCWQRLRSAQKHLKEMVNFEPQLKQIGLDNAAKERFGSDYAKLIGSIDRAKQAFSQLESVLDETNQVINRIDNAAKEVGLHLRSLVGNRVIKHYRGKSDDPKNVEEYNSLAATFVSSSMRKEPLFCIKVI